MHCVEYGSVLPFDGDDLVFAGLASSDDRLLNLCPKPAARGDSSVVSVSSEGLLRFAAFGSCPSEDMAASFERSVCVYNCLCYLIKQLAKRLSADQGSCA